MRLAAVALLTLMCVDLGMDLWQGETGDSNFDATNLSTPYTGQTALSISAGPEKPGPRDFDHECFCCCSHLEQQNAAIASIVLESGRNYFHGAANSSDPDLFPIHPPPQYSI